MEVLSTEGHSFAVELQLELRKRLKVLVSPQRYSSAAKRLRRKRLRFTAEVIPQLRGEISTAWASLSPRIHWRSSFRLVIGLCSENKQLSSFCWVSTLRKP